MDMYYVRGRGADLVFCDFYMGVDVYLRCGVGGWDLFGKEDKYFVFKELFCSVGRSNIFVDLNGFDLGRIWERFFRVVRGDLNGSFLRFVLFLSCWF